MYIEFDEGQKFSTNKNADQSESHEHFKDAGWVLTDDDLVIDIDDLPKESIEQMVKMFDIKTQYVWTNRGIHLYFKKPDTWRNRECICALGFKVEYKHKGNTKAVTIKQNGKLREIHNEGVRQPLPKYFEYTKNKYTNLVGFQDGDGRNDALYKHKISLNNMTSWQTILTFINWNVFAEPLEPSEFDTISRAEFVPEASKNNEYAIAEYLIRKLDFLQFGVSYYFKSPDDGDYVTNDDLLNQIIYKTCGEVATRYVDEVRKQMEYRCKKIPTDTVFKIKLKNGYLLDGQFIPIVIDEFTPYSIDVDYNPEAEPVEIVDDYISRLTAGDDDYKKLLLEVLGHTLIVNPEFKRLLAKFFIFVGDGGNGKGTLLQIIKQILNTKNCTAMSIRELSDERYLSAFKGKLANLGDDIQDQAINDKDMKILKNISTCDYISTRELYKNAEQMQFTGSLIFTSNHLIKSFEKVKSYKRRVSWLPMYTKVEKKDPLFITKLTTKGSLEYWIKLIVDGYQRLYEQHDFTKSEIVEKFNKEYHEENNPYLMYIQGKEKDDFIDIPITDVYTDCEEWCNDNGEEFKKTMFLNTLKEVLRIDNRGQKWLNGKNTKVFKEIDS